MASQRQGGLVTRVFTPKRAFDWDALEATLASWRPHKVDDNAALHAVNEIVPVELAETIRSLGNQLRTFMLLVGCAQHQIAIQKEPLFEEGGTRKQIWRIGAKGEDDAFERGMR